MPVSSNSFDDVTAKLLELITPVRVLDIGCGAGKYGRMVKSILPNAQIEGVEVEPSYIEKYNLHEVYSPMHVMNASNIIETMIDEAFDLTIIGDCIEHLPKSSGIDLINFLTYRSAFTVIVLPESSIQNTVDSIRSEAHISVWSERDFSWHDNWAFAQVWQMQYYILRGYAPSKLSLADVVMKLHACDFMLNYDTVNVPLSFTHLNHTKIHPIDNVSGAYWRQQ